jgi:hypothetical protein
MDLFEARHEAGDDRERRKLEYRPLPAGTGLNGRMPAEAPKAVELMYLARSRS